MTTITPAVYLPQNINYPKSVNNELSGKLSDAKIPSEKTKGATYTLAGQCEKKAAGKQGRVINDAQPQLRQPSVQADPKKLEDQAKFISSQINVTNQSITTKDNTSSEKPKFDITQHANSFSGRASTMLTITAQALQQSSMVEMHNSAQRSILAQKAAQSSADATIRSGKQAQQQAITSGIATMTVLTGGVVRQAKGIKSSNKALSTHGKSQQQFQNMSRQQTQALNKTPNGKNISPAQHQNDRQVLTEAQDSFDNSSNKHGLQLQINQNKANAISTQGQALTQTAMPLGSIAASEHQVQQSKEQAKSEIERNNQSTMQEGSTQSTKHADRAKQTMDAILMELTKILGGRNDTASSIAANMKA